MKDWREKIKERDWYKCVISWRKDNLVIHHIKTFWSWGGDAYCNMVTLNAFIHTGKVHWQEGWKYRKVLEEYVSQFSEPEDWCIYETIVEKTREYKNKSDRETDKTIRKYRKEKNTSHIEKQKNLKNEINRKKSKEIIKAKEKLFEDKYWMSSSQYKYRKQKEYLEAQKKK